MQQLRVPFIALLLALYLLPLPPEQVGAVSGGPLWHYAVYMFFHANLFHLLGNALSVYVVWQFRSDHPFVVAASLYGVALLAALITISDTPTVGASGVVFASVGFRLNRCRSLKTWGVVLLSVAVGALFSQINAALHGVALLGGWLVALVYHFFIRWADDYRSTFG